jgi:hypothetical protein
MGHYLGGWETRHIAFCTVIMVGNPSSAFASAMPSSSAPGASTSGGVSVVHWPIVWPNNSKRQNKKSDRPDKSEAKFLLILNKKGLNFKKLFPPCYPP